MKMYAIKQSIEEYIIIVRNRSLSLFAINGTEVVLCFCLYMQETMSNAIEKRKKKLQ